LTETAFSGILSVSQGRRAENTRLFSFILYLWGEQSMATMKDIIQSPLLLALVIGGKAGSFLGEYQAGGIILVLGLSQTRRPIVSNFPCTGMYGGKLYLRSDGRGLRLPEQVDARPAGEDDLAEIGKYVENYCTFFGGDRGAVMAAPFTVITPDTKNPYCQMYVLN